MTRELLRDIVEHTRGVAYRYRLWPTLGCEYVSDSAFELLGYSANQIYADPLLPGKIIHPDDRDLMRTALDVPEGEEVELELRWVRPDGRVVVTDVRCVVTRDAPGGAIVCDGVLREVTRHADERQRLEASPLRGGDGQSPGRGVVRVLIVDDDDLIRAGLRVLLADDPGLEVVGEAHNGGESLVLVSTLRPDLVLMDVRMPDMDGIQATRVLKESSPLTCVLVLTAIEDVQLLLDAVRAGAAGYVLKTVGEAQLRSAIWQAVGGGMPIDSQLMRLVLSRLADEQPSPQHTPSGDPLSPREREVLQLLVRGKSNREIAEELVVSSHTVKVHVEHILVKLHVSDRTQAAVRALELGYVSSAVAKAKPA